MTFKKLSVMALCAFLLTLAFSGVGNAASEETQSVYDVNYGGLRITITAPVEASPGENITVTVNTNASDVQQIHINCININFYGIVNSTTRVTLDQITHLNNVSVSSHEASYNIAIPENISPGLTYGEISCDWKALGASFEIPSSGFPLTYIKNVELEQLQAEYDELNTTHQSLVQNYTELSSDVNKDESAHSLMYVFIATTVVCVITIIVLLLRKPERVWV